MKTIVMTLAAFAFLFTACKKNDDEATITDYRDQFTGTYSCNDSTALYHPTWTGDSITGTQIDTIHAAISNILIEKMDKTDSSVSIAGEEFWIAKNGNCTRAYFSHPLGMSYDYNVSIINNQLNYTVRMMPLNLSWVSFRMLSGGKSK
jgi:hypothetical protein